MIEHQQGRFLHRQDPELIARAIAMLRKEAGSFRKAPRTEKGS